MALDPGPARDGEPPQQLGIAAPGVGPARHLADRERPRMRHRPRKRTRLEAAPLAGRAALRVRAKHPVEPERRREERIGHRPERGETAQLPELEGVGDDRRGAERQDEPCQRGRRGEGGRMHVRVDVAGDQHLRPGVDHARARPDHVVAGAHVGDPLALDGDGGRIDLAGIDVEQRSAAHVEIGRGGAASDVGEAPALSDGHD